MCACNACTHVCAAQVLTLRVFHPCTTFYLQRQGLSLSVAGLTCWLGSSVSVFLPNTGVSDVPNCVQRLCEYGRPELPPVYLLSRHFAE